MDGRVDAEQGRRWYRFIALSKSMFRLPRIRSARITTVVSVLDRCSRPPDRRTNRSRHSQWARPYAALSQDNRYRAVAIAYLLTNRHRAGVADAWKRLDRSWCR